ncbi:MAG TPA: SPOR domain-containing protein [Methyloceanibacter sp.]
MLRNRRSEEKNWTKGLLAFFWIVLAGFSALYLFTLFGDPTAFGGQTAKLGTAFSSADTTGSTSGLTADQAAQLIEANEARDKELAEIKVTMAELAQQLSDLSARVAPNEKVASAAPASSVTAKPPEPKVTAPLPKKPEVAAAPVVAPPPPAPEKPVVKPAEDKAPEKPAPVTVAVAEPKPIEKPEAKPAAATPPPPVTTSEPGEDDAADVEKPKVPPVTVSEPDEPPAEEPAPSTNLSAPAPQAAATPSTAQSSTATPSSAPAEVANLDPIVLPPAANDGSTRYGIEIGTVAKQDGLRPLWREFLTNHAALVAGLQPRRVLAPDKKWRLVAGPFANAAEAEQACALFKKASRPCEATVYAGDGL